MNSEVVSQLKLYFQVAASVGAAVTSINLVRGLYWKLVSKTTGDTTPSYSDIGGISIKRGLVFGTFWPGTLAVTAVGGVCSVVNWAMDPNGRILDPVQPNQNRCPLRLHSD